MPELAINGEFVKQLHIPPSTLFEPGYEEFTDFPQNLPADSTFELRLIQPRLPGEPPSPYIPVIWGFISVTNNGTQEITIISPQP